MYPPRVLFRLLLTAVALVPVVGACSSDDDALVLYSGRTRALIEPLIEDFEEASGIDVDVRFGNSADLALQIETEGDKTDVDVFLSQSPGAVGYLEDLGLLAPLTDDELELVDEDFRAADGDWIGVSGRVRVLAYNTDLVDPEELPDSVLDLTSEEFAGRVAVAPTNGSFQDFVTAMRIELGEDVATDWLEGMAANDAPTYSNNVAILEAVSRGEAEMGLVNHYYLVRALAEDPDLPVVNHFFEEGDIGSLLITTAAAIIEGNDKPDEAKALVDFLLSTEAQEFYAERTKEYPLARGVEPPETLPPLADVPKFTIDLDALGGGLARTAELIQDSGLDRS